MLISDSLIKIGLSKNEAEIYQALLEFGEMPVSEISKKALIHRRNVYDCMNRLLEKGLVSEVLSGKENRYRAVDPLKLTEILAEKESILTSIMPKMQKTYRSRPQKEEVYLLRGLEGWKNYMREIIRIGEDVYTIGGGGLWTDPQLSIFFEDYLKKTKDINIKYKILYDHNVLAEGRRVRKLPGVKFKILPKKYMTKASVDVFGDHVVVLTKGKDFKIDDSILTVIINQDIADSFKVWFSMMWKMAHDHPR